MDDVSVFVAALVTAESQKRQGYFLFCDRDGIAAAVLRAGRATALREIGLRRRASGALRFVSEGAVRTAGFATGAARRAACAVRRVSLTGARCTMVNRVWSPIVW